MKNSFVGIVFGVLFLLLCPVAASAQTHPCDITPVQGESFSGPVKVAFCSTSKDTDGLPTSINTVKVFVDANATPTQTGILPAPTGSSPNAAGQNYYVMPPITLAKGNHSIKVTTVSAAGESLSSLPFAFVQVLAVPDVVTGVRAIK